MTRSASWFRTKAGRRDANHAAIRDALRALGHFVVDTASVGGGVPDLAVFVRGADPTWLEVKVAKGRVEDSQIAWRQRAESFGVRVRVARTLAEALEAIT